MTGDTTVALFPMSGFILFCTLGYADACRPSIIPDAYHLEHLTTVQAKLIARSGLVGPENRNLVTGMDVVLRIIILERR
jgi:hypothetical protein